MTGGDAEHVPHLTARRHRGVCGHKAAGSNGPHLLGCLQDQCQSACELASQHAPCSRQGI